MHWLNCPCIDTSFSFFGHFTPFETEGLHFTIQKGPYDYMRLRIHDVMIMSTECTSLREKVLLICTRTRTKIIEYSAACCVLFFEQHHVGHKLAPISAG